MSLLATLNSVKQALQDIITLTAQVTTALTDLETFLSANL